MTDHETADGAPVDCSQLEDVEPLGRSAAAGALWLTGQKWVARVTGLVTIAVLTRLLAPAEFGVVAAASSITPFVLLLSDLGFSTYLVQADRPGQRTLSTGFWFSLAVGLLLSVALFAAAPLIAAAFHLPQAVSVLQAMPLCILPVVLSSVPEALLKRRMEFGRLAARGTAAALVGQVVAIVIAVRGGGAWALVGQLLAANTVGLLLVWVAARWRPSFQFSGTEFRTMASFGVKVVSVDLISTTRTAVEAAIISSALGAAALGFVSVAQRLISVVQDLGAAAILPVATVVFARVRESGDRLRSAYLRALGVSYAAVSPMLALVAVGAPLIVPLLFGDGWGKSVPVAQALAVAAILTLGAMLDHALHYGAGRPGRWLAYAVVTDIVTVLVTAAMAPHGLTAVALGFVVVALVATVARWFLVGRLVGLSPRAPAAALGRVTAALAPAAVAGLAVRAATAGVRPLPALVLIGLAVVLIYVPMLRLTSPRVIREALDVLPLPARLRSWRFLA